MSQEVFELIRVMDMKNIEAQLALQCAPVIAGLKLSNLLNTRCSELWKVKEILKDTEISCQVLLMQEKRVTLLLYRKSWLESYLAEKDSKTLLQELGYEMTSFEAVLPEFCRRYRSCVVENQPFPHELGVLLGYPIEDIKGFMQKDRSTLLYTGYWKVYGNLEEKRVLFGRFDQAKDRIIQLVSDGVSIKEIMKTYYEHVPKKAAV